MPVLQKSCFISYSHDGIDRDTLSFFVSTLEEAIKPNAKIYIDNRVKYGEDFRDFMNLVESVDLIILILTPTYKQRVVDRTGGVYQEFKCLYDRYCSFQDLENERETKEVEIFKKFDLIPVLFSGSREQSVPEEIKQAFKSTRPNWFKGLKATKW